MTTLAHLALNEEGFVFNPLTGDSFQASAVGLRILHWLRDGASDDDVIQNLTEDFEVTPDTARRDLADFKGALQNYGLL